MHRKIRVLVVDDSVTMRRILSDAISSDAELEVAGYAANGQIAMAMFDQVSPDIVTLDIEMPVMDGLATLKAMRAARRLQPVIMFSTLTERGAEATIDSLALGASDYVAKPIHAGSLDAARERIREALIPKIKALCRIPASEQSSAGRRPGQRNFRFVGPTHLNGSRRWSLAALPAAPTHLPPCCQDSPPIFPCLCSLCSTCLRPSHASWHSG